MTSDNLPKFENPPVVETVIGVQFEETPQITTSAVGWYWGECLRENWKAPREASPLESQFEDFDKPQRWKSVGPQFMLATGPTPTRSQIERSDGARMIQIQNTRFIYNWKSNNGDYPSFGEIKPEFDTELSSFLEFFGQHFEGFNAKFNQWEMTYVNHIPRSELWNSPQDWSRVLPGFYPVVADESLAMIFENQSSECHWVLEGNRGRLHASIQQGVASDPNGEKEVLALHLTARGPLKEDPGESLNEGLRLGHEAIVRAFACMTSEAAHKVWGRCQ